MITRKKNKSFKLKNGICVVIIVLILRLQKILFSFFYLFFSRKVVFLMIVPSVTEYSI